MQVYRCRFPPYNHGQPIRYVSFAPVAGILLSVMVLLLPTVWRPSDHALLIDLPPGYYSDEYFDPDYPVNVVTVTAIGEILWNGEAVSSRGLSDALDATLNDKRYPGLIFEPEPSASYDLTVKVLALISNSGLAGYGFCFGGLEQHGQFGREGSDPLPLKNPPPPMFCDPSWSRHVW